MNDALQNLMREATRLTQAGQLNAATEAIQRALSGAARAAATLRPVDRDADPTAPAAGRSALAPASPLVLDGCVFERDARPAGTAESGADEFSSGAHTHAALTRRYKLYQPPGQLGQRLPLVVMLHGCTQDPDDFAAGTAMNERAREQGFYVLYPAQSQDGNASRCWNWFKHNHQRRQSGEAALLADMTRAVISHHRIDPRRVYIAGLSAGGAMTAIVTALFPEIFAAAGVHSGLPSGAASNLAEALTVMQSGVAGPANGKSSRAPIAPAVPVRTTIAVPTIVFHGDQDQTVHPRNGERVIAAVLAAAAAGHSDGAPAVSARVEQGVSSQGRRYTRAVHGDHSGKAVAEHWLLHGAGHAWSGGRAQGSYTDAEGPDATAEMLRFFFQQSGAVKP